MSRATQHGECQTRLLFSHGSIIACVIAFGGCSDAGGDLGSTETVGTAELSVHTACADGPVVEGIDVSYYQDQPDWPAVAADGWTFAITRVNHGGFMDPEFDTNWQAIKEVGLVRGAYQYFDPGGDPVEQANVFIDKVGVLGPGDLPGVIDVESTDGQSPATITENVLTWVEMVEAATGRKPIVYTGSYFWDDNVASEALNEHPLWTAHYTTSCPLVADAWQTWKLWQYTSTGSVAGISGNVDNNQFNGTLEQLHDFAANGYRAEVLDVDYEATMIAGTTASVSIELRNVGARSWDDSTILGTTMPRDRESAFATSGWLNATRVVGVTEAAANGDVVTFEFDITAPLESGSYSEHFNLVQEGVAWFSDTDPGGGPNDDVIVLNVEVTPDESSNVSAGVGGAGSAGAGGASNSDGALRGIPNSGESSCTTTAPGRGPADERPVGWMWLTLAAPWLLRRRPLRSTPPRR